MSGATASRLEELHGQHQLSEVLRAFAAHSEVSVPVGTLLAALGARAHGMALLIFVLPEAIPLPIPSASAILGVPLVLIAFHLMLFGEGAGFPQRFLAIKVPISAIRMINRYLGPTLEWLENLTRPRWHRISGREHVVGAVCTYLAVVLLLPIPFVNFAPAVCLAAISFGLVQRDGVFVVAGMIGTVVLTLTLTLIGKEIVSWL